jgi:peroxiredoxin
MHTLLIVAVVLPWVLVAVLVFIVYVLMRQHGEFLHGQQQQQQQLLAMNAAAAPMPDTRAGLEVGAEAPDLVLTDVDGRERRLGEFRGQPHVLAFFSTHCGYCKEMAPQFSDLPVDSPRFVLISSGDPAELRSLASEHDWKFDVLVEDADWRAFKSYEPVGTPSAYLVDAEGKIAAQLAVGSPAVLQLLKSASAPSAQEPSNGHQSGEDQAAVERARRAGPRVAGTEESRIQRNGLPAGTVAPNVVLPDLEGDMHSLADFRGRRVLLVFSDAHCGPCDALAPDLVDIAANRDVQVVMINRGGAEANRQKADQHGYPFPVLLQKSWEVSKQYGMFATPIAYLIDEHGVLAADVAVGGDAILGLVPA